MMTPDGFEGWGWLPKCTEEAELYTQTVALATAERLGARVVTHESAETRTTLRVIRGGREGFASGGPALSGWLPRLAAEAANAGRLWSGRFPDRSPPVPLLAVPSMPTPQALDDLADRLVALCGGGLAILHLQTVRESIRIRNTAGLDASYERVLFRLSARVLEPGGQPMVEAEAAHGDWEVACQRLMEEAERYRRWSEGEWPARAGRFEGVVLVGGALRPVLEVVAASRAGLPGAPPWISGFPAVFDRPLLPGTAFTRPFDDEGFPVTDGEVGAGGRWAVLGDRGGGEPGHAVRREGVPEPGCTFLSVPPGPVPWASLTDGSDPVVVVDRMTVLNDPGADGLLHCRIDRGWVAWRGRVEGRAPVHWLRIDLPSAVVEGVGSELWQTETVLAPAIRFRLQNSGGILECE